jgi:hypothetical protein
METKQGRKKMSIKECFHCKRILSLGVFWNDKSGKYGKHHVCIDCSKKKYKKYYDNTIDKENFLAKKRYYYKKNRELILAKAKKYYIENYEYARKKSKDYSKKNLWRLRLKRANNSQIRLDLNFSLSVYKALKGKKSGRHWELLVDYSLNDLTKHLENQFDSKMNWENYGRFWHIDHIIPKSYFKYEYPEDREFKQCWSLANLQPLEATENLRKHTSLNYTK